MHHCTAAPTTITATPTQSAIALHTHIRQAQSLWFTDRQPHTYTAMQTNSHVHRKANTLSLSRTRPHLTVVVIPVAERALCMWSVDTIRSLALYLCKCRSPTLTLSALWNLKSELRAPAPLTAAQLGPQQQPQQSNWNFSFVLIIDSCGRRTRAESSNSRSSVAAFSSRISRSVQHANPVVVVVVVELLVQQ